MKVAINRCWGGFSLSPKAVKRLAALEGRQCYFYDNPREPRLDIHKIVPISLEQAEKSFLWYAYDIPNAHEINWSPENWPELSQEERQRLNQDCEAHSISNRPRDHERANPNLIRVIEELGTEANGSHAEIEIVEIPDGVEWIIDDYDGMESVHEAHRVWS